MHIHQPKIILASSSRYRAQLLERLRLKFSIESSDIDETKTQPDTAKVWAERLSTSKAESVAKKHPDALTIGSDQVAEFAGETIGKPGTAENAVRQLMSFSGNKVAFHTAVTLISPAKNLVLSTTDTTWVYFRELESAEVIQYVDIESPLDCAGSFKCEGLGISLFSRIESSDPTALVGLPLIGLCDLLRRAGINLPSAAR